MQLDVESATAPAESQFSAWDQRLRPVRALLESADGSKPHASGRCVARFGGSDGERDERMDPPTRPSKMRPISPGGRWAILLECGKRLKRGSPRPWWRPGQKGPRCWPRGPRGPWQWIRAVPQQVHRERIPDLAALAPGPQRLRPGRRLRLSPHADWDPAVGGRARSRSRESFQRGPRPDPQAVRAVGQTTVGLQSVRSGLSEEVRRFRGGFYGGVAQKPRSSGLPARGPVSR